MVPASLLSSSPLSFQAVLFDLDGTLADTLADIGHAMNHALAQRGHPRHPLEAYRELVGEGAENLARRALPEGRGSEEEVQLLLADYRAYYAAHLIDFSRPYPGIAELLDRLVGQGIPMAVLSNKREEFTRGCVEKLLGRWTFAEVRGDRPGAPRKPDPSSALEIAGKLGVAPADIAFVGDTRYDMEAANRAGMMAVGVAWGFRPAAELLAHGARRILHRPLELFDR